MFDQQTACDLNVEVKNPVERTFIGLFGLKSTKTEHKLFIIK